MARRPITDLSAWPSITLEGNLIPPAMLSRIDERSAFEQDPEDYGVRRGLTLREEISTAFRVGQSHFDAFAKIEKPSVDATRRFVKGLLLETFGFDDIADGEGLTALFAGDRRIPIVVVPPSEERLDRRSPTLSVDRSRSPAFVLQDHLNEHDEALWGLVTNGTIVRLMRDNASLTRLAFFEADLAQIFSNEDAASFGLLWLLMHRSRFGAATAPATDCALERWRDAGTKEGEVARDRLADQVKEALKLLGSGFLEANPDLTARLQSGEVNLTDWFNELLRLVYRLIFLMVAEDRNLLHPRKSQANARQLYADGYSLAHLRAQCFRGATWDRHHDRFEGVKVVFRSLAYGQEALALPALGGLFAADMLPSLEGARLRNRAFMEALYRLSWLKGKTGMAPVNWRAMETEELGSVYESLLELQPQLGEDGRTLVFASDAAEQKGNQRKTTGSYYTPDSLVQALLDTALDPVLDKTETEADDPEAALLNLSVIDPACGSGHFLLAAARRIATRVAGIRADGTPAQEDFRHALRDVARSCIHGVDRNPMAVELTKVALWIETVDPGLPLGFFDAQIRCGDALLGVFDLGVLEEGIPDAAYKPLTGDDKDVAKYYREKNKRETKERERIAAGFGFNRQQDFMREFARLRAMPEDTVRQIEAKAEKLRALTAEGAAAWTLDMACDLYVSAFLVPKTKDGPHAGPDGLPRRGAEAVATSGTVWEWLRGVPPFGPLFGTAIDATCTARAFHWPLEFPNIMQHGGFDVVLGNPPWEVLQLSEKEYFAAHMPDVAALPGAKRKAAIRRIEESDPKAYQEFIATKRLSEAVNEFSRSSGRFALSARGKTNTYSLFAELFDLAICANGRAGLIVPTGIATDSSTAPFFSHLIENQRLSDLVDFENRERVFPGIYYRVKFCLLTIGPRQAETRFSFFLKNTSQLAESERKFALTANDIIAINPNTRTAPVFRTRADAELTAKIYQNSPVLIDESKGKEGNPWGVEFRQGLFNLASDSELFRMAPELERDGLVRSGNIWLEASSYSEAALPSSKETVHEGLAVEGAYSHTTRQHVPLLEAKMVHQFDHRWSGYSADGSATVDPTDDEKSDPTFEPLPRYWVSESDVTTQLRNMNWPHAWLAGWRDIANVVNERTTIACIFPRFGVGHSEPLFFLNTETEYWCAFCANLNSMTLDFVARQKIGGTHLTYSYVKQFPVLPPGFYSKCRLTFVSARVLELTYTSHSLAPFAHDLGYDGPPFAWDEDRRAHLRADLDAFYARAYGLSRDDLRYILDPADVKGEDYPSETFRVLKEREIKQFGEFRTHRLVLEAWDRMEAEGTFVELGLADAPAIIAPQQIRLPPLDQLPEAVWAWQQGADERDRVRTQLRAMIGILPEASDIRRVRLAALACLQPSLLDSFLNESDCREWRRLVAHTTGVTQLVPPTNAAWGAAFNELVSSAVLDVAPDGSSWVAGGRLDRSTLSADDPAVGRALFAWSRLQEVDLEQGLTQVSAEIIPFIREGRLAA